MSTRQKLQCSYCHLEEARVPSIEGLHSYADRLIEKKTIFEANYPLDFTPNLLPVAPNRLFCDRPKSATFARNLLSTKMFCMYECSQETVKHWDVTSYKEKRKNPYLGFQVTMDYLWLSRVKETDTLRYISQYGQNLFSFDYHCLVV